VLPILLGLHLARGQTMDQAKPVAQEVARVSPAGLLHQHLLGNAGVAVAARHLLDRARHHAGVLRRQLAAIVGGGDHRQRRELASQPDLGVGGAGADVQVVGEPGGARQALGEVALRVGPPGGRVHGADDARDRCLDPVALADGDAQHLGQLAR